MAESAPIRCLTPHPNVDSLAPARSALRASGFTGLFSPFPKRLKSPREKGQGADGHCLFSKSQRDSIIQPRVARNELPWGDDAMNTTLKGLNPFVPTGDATPLETSAKAVAQVSQPAVSPTSKSAERGNIE